MDPKPKLSPESLAVRSGAVVGLLALVLITFFSFLYTGGKQVEEVTGRVSSVSEPMERSYPCKTSIGQNAPSTTCEETVYKVTYKAIGRDEKFADTVSHAPALEDKRTAYRVTTNSVVSYEFSNPHGGWANTYNIFSGFAGAVGFGILTYFAVRGVANRRLKKQKTS